MVADLWWFAGRLMGWYLVTVGLLGDYSVLLHLLIVLFISLFLYLWLLRACLLLI